MIKLFYFKQFNLAEVICLRTVLKSNSSIWLIDRTTLGREDLGAMTMNVYSAFHKAPALLEPDHQIV